MAGLTIVERYTQPVYDGWKVDTRDGNGNINVDAPFRKKMRLFTGTSSNPRMSNMMIPGRLVADRTGMVKRVGVFSSFSMESHKLLFKKEVMKQLGAAIVNRSSSAHSQVDIVPPPELPVTPTLDGSTSGRLSR